MPDQSDPVLEFPEVAGKPPERAGTSGSARGTVYLIGVDAMTLNAIGPLMEAGDLPGFRRMAEQGGHSTVKTLVPTISAAIWTSIACGRPPEEHGIDALDYFRLGRLRISKGAHRVLRRLGLKKVLAALARRGWIKRCRFSSSDLPVKTIWDVVSERGGRIGVVNWLNTWPAYPVNGYVVSDRTYPWRSADMQLERPKHDFLTWPEDLIDELRDCIMSPEGLSVRDLRRYVAATDEEIRGLMTRPYEKHSVGAELRHAVASDLSAANCFRHCLESQGPIDLAACFFWGMDKVQHAAYRFMPFVDSPDVSAAHRKMFGGMVPESYRLIDGVICDVFGRMGPDDSIIVCSDHGFGSEARRGFGHKRSNPPGVLFAMGGPFRRGHVGKPVSVYAIPATVLRLCGLPLDLHMRGAPLEHWLTDKYRAAHPAQERIESYGGRGPDYGALPSGTPCI